MEPIWIWKSPYRYHLNLPAHIFAAQLHPTILMPYTLPIAHRCCNHRTQTHTHTPLEPYKIKNVNTMAVIRLHRVRHIQTQSNRIHVQFIVMCNLIIIIIKLCNFWQGWSARKNYAYVIWAFNLARVKKKNK